VIRICLLIWIVLTSSFVSAKEEVQISLLTSDPGDLPYTLFGHSALRVKTNEGFDRIYNFGLFKFSTPNFGLKFLGGELEYWLGRQTVEGFIEVNNKEKRLIREQVLNLDNKVAVRIYNKLDSRHQSDEKYYRYSFTSKNCTSEIRDILKEEGLIEVGGETKTSFREMINDYLDEASWIGFGMNLVLGTEVDRQINYEESLFLPADLERAVDNTAGLVRENNVLNEPEPLTPGDWIRYLYSPFLIFLLIAGISIFWSPKWFRILWYSIFGLMGVFLTYLWLTTLHPEIQNNFNVLWCNPFLVLLIVAMVVKKWIKAITIILFFCLLLTIILWLFGVQSFSWAVLPIILMLIQFFIKERKAVYSTGT
jgi:hypothetical protein